jgi:hypothetical protein
MLMKLMKQKNKNIFLLCEYMGPTSFLYTYILLQIQSAEGRATSAIPGVPSAAA